MQVQINEVVSTVRAVDGDALLSPRTMSRIVQTVLAAIEQRELHDGRAGAETRISAGVASEQSEARP